jgi:hypothetical protein
MRYAVIAFFTFLMPVLVFAGGSPTAEKPMLQKDSVVAVEPSGERAINFSPVQPNNKQKPDPEKYDYRKDGLFIGLFHVGLNFSQIDGDAYWGYSKLGFDAGVGTMVRISRHFAPSIELNYSMWGGQATLLEKNGDQYKTNLNYAQIPIAINILDKEIIMFSAGVNIGYLAAFKERNETGTIITDTVSPQPKRVDVDGFLALHVIIQKQFAIGIKFSYSFVPFRGIEEQYSTLTKITSGEYNNVVTLRFMYILKATTFKKKGGMQNRFVN